VYGEREREGAGDVIGRWLNSNRTCPVYVPRHEQTVGSDRTLPLGSDRTRLYSCSLTSNVCRGRPNTPASPVSTDRTCLVMFFMFWSSLDRDWTLGLSESGQ
jgi:hypothetical protein